MNISDYRILILGCGYVGGKIALAAKAEGAKVVPVSRKLETIHHWEGMGLHPLLMEGSPATLDRGTLAGINIIIDSIPLTRTEGSMRCTQPDWLPALLQCCPKLQQAIYLSSTSVYGNANGDWVNEQAACRPSSSRGQQRLIAEESWQHAASSVDTALTIFRLAGIYGQERNIHHRLLAGGYQAIRWNPDHYSNRIHVDDITTALLAAMNTSAQGIFNISDDHPLPHADYVLQLAKHLHAPTPEILTPEQGEQALSPTLISFFQDNKRINNARMHQELCSRLCYPSFNDSLP